MDLKDLRASRPTDRPPVEIAAFNKMYRRTRMWVNAVIAVSIAIMSFRFEERLVVVPGVIALSLGILIHAWRKSEAALHVKLTIDTVAYMVMIVLIDVPEVAMLVALAQTSIGYLTVSPALSRRLTTFQMGLGLVTTLVTIAFDWQQRTTLDTMMLVLVVGVMAAVPTIWTLSQLGVLILSQQDREKTLLRETKQLLIDKDRFVASVSHELRTPLTAVVGLAHTLADDAASLSQQERDEFTSLIVDQSEEVAAIVDDLLVAARAGSGHLALVVGEVDLLKEIEAVSPKETPIEIVGEGPFIAVADPIRVRQVLRNLVSNAQRYGGEQKRIRVSRRGVMGIIQIQDDGQPIAVTQMETIFTAYGRAHDRPGRTDSVGLGLTVSRQLARMMGGDVTYSHDGRWAAFELAVPLAVTDTARAICASPEAALAAHLGGAR